MIATYAIEMLPNYDDVIARLADRMPDDGRIAVLGLRDPDNWPEWLIRLGSAINRPFGVSEDYRSHRPWEVIERHTTDTTHTEAFAGRLPRHRHHTQPPRGAMKTPRRRLGIDQLRAC